METELNNRREITMDAGKANIIALIFVFPVIVFLFIPYVIFWAENFSHSLFTLITDNIFIVLVFIICGAALHELIHGFFWSFFLVKGFKSIKFGIKWSSLTPYCHSKEPMKLKYYRLGAIMPCIILGIIPSVFAILSGSLSLFLFGFFFTMAAGGDLLMIWLLRNENRNVLVQDHPDKIGCIILD